MGGVVFNNGGDANPVTLVGSNVGSPTAIGIPYAPYLSHIPNGVIVGPNITADTRIPAGGSDSGLGPTVWNLTGVSDPHGGMGDTFYDRVHIKPNVIEFGPILAEETRRVEIYNANRRTPVQLSTIVNPASPGITVPDTPIGTLLPAQQSFILAGGDSFTQGGYDDFLARVVADRDGVPSFNGLLSFTWSGFTVSVRISGSRVELMPFRYEMFPIDTTLQFLGSRFRAPSGRSQRLSHRDRPREILPRRFRLEGSQRAHLDSFLFGAKSKIVGIPIFEEAIDLDADAAIGATTLQCTLADVADFRVGGLAALIVDDYVFNVVNIKAITATDIELEDPLPLAYAEGTEIVPVRLARMLPQSNTQEPPVNLKDFTLTFVVIDNTTGAIDATLPTGPWSMLDGKVFFDNCNVWRGRSTARVTQAVTLIDNLTGQPSIASVEPYSTHEFPRRFTVRGRAEKRAFRQLLNYHRGPQRSFWAPSDHNDIEVLIDLAGLGNTMTIRGIGYTRQVRNLKSRNRIRLTLTNGTKLFRTITASEIDGSDPRREILTVDTEWSGPITVAEIVRVEFVDTFTFAADSFRLREVSPGVIHVDTVIRRDLNP